MAACHQTLKKKLWHAALLRRCEIPCKRKCWTNTGEAGGSLVNSVLWAPDAQGWWVLVPGVWRPRLRGCRRRSGSWGRPGTCWSCSPGCCAQTCQPEREDLLKGFECLKKNSKQENKYQLICVNGTVYLLGSAIITRERKVISFTPYRMYFKHLY